MPTTDTDEPVASRLDALRIGEVSGVDHPAHLSEGWMVLKAETGLSDDEMAEVIAEARALAKDALPDGSFPINSVNDLHNAIRAYGRAKDLPRAKAHIIANARRLGRTDMLPGVWGVGGDSATSKAQSQSPSTEVAMTDTTGSTATLGEDVIKSLPEEVRKALDTANEVAQTALTELRKEREQRLDVEAIAKARDEFPAIPELNPDEFGPAMRKAAEAAPEETAILLKALTTANAALAESILLKEVGSSVTPAAGGRSVVKSADTSAYAHIQSVAQSLLDAGTVDTLAQGIAKALTDNPDMYADYQNEQRG